MVCFAELFDNGIRAEARKLELSLARCKKGNPATITYSDDGVRKDGPALLVNNASRHQP